MIDSHIIDSLPEEAQLNAKLALASLSRNQVFKRQLEFEKENLLRGSNDESEVDLAKSILAYRTKTQQLETLDQIGEYYAKELES